MAKTSAKVRTRQRGKTWSYIFEAGTNEKGKRKVVEKGGFPTQQEAYIAGVEAFTSWMHGDIGITSEKIFVEDYMKSWLENVASTNVKASSLEHYKAVARLWVLPYFQKISVQDVTPAKVDSWMRALLKKGYAKTSIKTALVILRIALDYAVFPAELIRSNPARYIKVPKAAPTGVIARTIISREQYHDLLEKHPFNTTYHIPIILLFHTGMRIGEVMGLSWSDVDFEKNTISLKQQLVAGNIFTSLKSKSSERFIVMDAILTKELQRWKRCQKQNEWACGSSYVYTFKGKDGKLIQQSKGIPLNASAERIPLVCTSPVGKVASRCSLSHLLSKDGLNCHSFRHTHATMLIEAGATPKGAASRLGHASTAITQDLYTHNTRRLQEETASLFARALQTS